MHDNVHVIEDNSAPASAAMSGDDGDSDQDANFMAELAIKKPKSKPLQ